MIVLYLATILFVFYAGLIVYYWLAWKSIPEFVPAGGYQQAKISVIIPARNEQENIISCLGSISGQKYPEDFFEVIVVDDCSIDNTWQLVRSFPHTPNILPIRLEPIDDSKFSAHKKRAIQSGIKLAHNPVIVTTDADCKHPTGWLETLAEFYYKRSCTSIVAPVDIDNNNSLLESFQALDFLVLQGITGAAVGKNIHPMCNGANLLYVKDVFHQVGGFEGIDHVASGDDMLLMHKIWQRYPGGVHYLKSRTAIVSTQPMKTWREFFSQRIRWASKARFYNDWRIKAVLLLVYLFNLSFLVLFITAFWLPVLWMWLFILLIAKTIVEYPFVHSVAKFFNKQPLLRYFFFFQPIHICYTIVAGWLGQITRYQWKGRTVK